MKRITMILAAVLLLIGGAKAAETFEVKNPDSQLSPFTGMTRDHWKQAALYLLEPAFKYTDGGKAPMSFPKQEGKSYPRKDSEIATSQMEALCRTMFLAGPLLKEDKDLTLHGVKVADYYRSQIVSFLDKNSPFYLPPKTWRGNGGQKLVELGGLSVSLLLAPEVFWDPIPKDLRDSLAAVFTTYAEGETIDMNWRFFNMCLLSFLDGQGYQVNKAYLEDLLHKNLAAYVGDGWYHDAPLFDYYSMWAFQMYGPLWAQSYGNKHYPVEAAQFMNNLSKITRQYPYMFGRDGKMQMWGRSITYRMGAAIPLALTGYLDDSSIEYGWMRRICSGALLQFLTNKDFIADDGLPNLGFYGHFEPCLQHYSCRGSVFWMAKIFLALYMPKDSPFWTATETEGAWTRMKQNEIYMTYSEKTRTLTADHPELGMAEFRNVFTRNSGFYYGLENYNRLAYNSALLWQADGEDGEVAMCYVTRPQNGKWESINSYVGEGLGDDGIFRRKASYKNSKMTIGLSESIVNGMIIRNDTVRNATEGEELRMGFYALPNIGKSIIETVTELKNGRKAITIDNGEWQLTTVLLDGWEGMEAVHCNGLHPQTTLSTVVDLYVKPKDGTVLRSILIMSKSNAKVNIKKIVNAY